jgi:hypothetical protein
MPHDSFTSRVVGKAGKFVYRNKILKPFLSGDLFASESDLNIPVEFHKRRNFIGLVRDARVIFCNGYLVQDFIDSFGKQLSGKVLIVGNSDKDWYEFPISLTPGIKSIFLQNSFVPDSRIVPLPIGIENLSYYRNGRLRNFRESFILSEKIDKVLVGPFSPTHEVRRALMEDFLDSPRIDVISNRFMEPYQYAKVSSTYGYIASPRGNGEDTHRTWESLYRGSSPVLLRNEWSESLSSLGLPVSYVDEWTPEGLDTLDPFTRFVPSEIQSLWWPYWRSKIRSLF